MNKLSDYLPTGEVPTFEQFYKGYPKKTEKRVAAQRWEKLTDQEKCEAVLDVPRRHDQHAQWKDRNFIPNPARYLLNKMWRDDIVESRTVEDEQAELDDGSNLGRFWTLMKQIYGNDRIKRQYGETMPVLWQKALAGATKKEIGKIINYLMNDTEPGLPDLGKICRIRRIGKEERFKSLDKPRNKELALEELEKIKDMLK